MTVEVYQDAAGRWRWRVKAKNGAIVASSGESFDNHANASRAVTTASREFESREPKRQGPQESAAEDGEEGGSA